MGTIPWHFGRRPIEERERPRDDRHTRTRIYRGRNGHDGDNSATTFEDATIDFRRMIASTKSKRNTTTMNEDDKKSYDIPIIIRNEIILI